VDIWICYGYPENYSSTIAWKSLKNGFTVLLFKYNENTNENTNDENTNENTDENTDENKFCRRNCSYYFKMASNCITLFSSNFKNRYPNIINLTNFDEYYETMSEGTIIDDSCESETLGEEDTMEDETESTATSTTYAASVQQVFPCNICYTFFENEFELQHCRNCNGALCFSCIYRCRYESNLEGACPLCREAFGDGLPDYPESEDNESEYSYETDTTA